MSARNLALAVGALATLAACNSDTPSPTETAAEASAPMALAKGDKRDKHVEVISETDVTRQLENTLPTNNWVLYFRPTATSATFRDGPGTPPQGEGSFEMITPTPADKFSLFNFEYLETPIADFTELGYQTYRTSGTADQLPSLNLTIDHNGPAVTGGFATLVFEPVYNPAQGEVDDGVWQDWDAIRGGEAIWWSTRPFGTVCPIACYVSWNTILQQAPDATILGGIGPNQGSGGAALTASVDEFIVNVGRKHATIYDFELCDSGKHGKKDKCKDKKPKHGHDDE